MHEMNITQQLLDIALDKATEAGARRIKQINLVIGDMATVVDNCIQFYFDIISRNTLAEGARLSFRRIPIEVKCRRCGRLFTPVEKPWKCPGCAEWDVEIIRGEEFYIDSLEVE